MLVLAAPPMTTSVEAATWYVNPGGSIQAAVNAAAPNDTIVVAAGSYPENVVVNKNLILLGAQAGVDARGRVAAETIVGTVSGTAIYVTNAAQSITIDGFSIRGGRPIVNSYAQSVTFVNNICTLTDARGSNGITEIHGGSNGVLIQHNDIVNSSVTVNPTANDLAVTVSSSGVTAYVTIDGNDLHNASGSGIGFANTNSGIVAATVTNNRIFDNRQNGILTTSSDLNPLTIANNDIYNNGGWGVNVGSSTTGDININYNNIYGNTLGGVTNANAFWVDADYNWWGASDGPSGVGPGSGDAVSTYVTYSPFMGSQMCPGGAAMTTATGSGTAIFCPTAGSVQNLTAVSEGSVPAGGKPALIFAHGLFEFDISGLSNGGTVTLTITLPSAVPTTTQYWKYGPTSTNPAGEWYVISMGDNDGDNVITITLVDGGLGDDDLAGNGIIIDQGGPGWPPPPTGGGGATSAPAFPSIYIGIGAALGAGILAYGVRRRLATHRPE